MFTTHIHSLATRCTVCKTGPAVTKLRGEQSKQVHCNNENTCPYQKQGNRAARAHHCPGPYGGGGPKPLGG